MLHNFTLMQLLKHNIHLGSQTSYWNTLNKDLIGGKRQFYYILNCNLTVINLRRSFLLIETLYSKNLATLFYHYDLNFKSFFCNNIKFFNLLRLRITLGRWMPGFLTNFKIYYNFVLKKLMPVFKLFYVKHLRDWFITRFHKFWFFFLLLRAHRSLPAAMFSFNTSPWVVAESRNILIPSMVLLDTSASEQLLNQTTFLIPFNFFNLNSLIFLIVCLNKLYLKNIFRQKKFFFLLISSILKDKFSVDVFSYCVSINYGFSLLSNFHRYDLVFANKCIRLFHSLGFLIYMRLLVLKAFKASSRT